MRKKQYGIPLPLKKVKYNKGMIELKDLNLIYYAFKFINNFNSNLSFFYFLIILDWA